MTPKGVLLLPVSNPPLSPPLREGSAWPGEAPSPPSPTWPARRYVPSFCLVRFGIPLRCARMVRSLMLLCYGSLEKGLCCLQLNINLSWFCCCRQSVPNVETPDLLFVRHLCSQFQDFFLSWVCALAWCYRVDARPQFDLASEEIFGNDCVDSSLKLMILFMILQSHQQINGDWNGIFVLFRTIESFLLIEIQ